MPPEAREAWAHLWHTSEVELEKTWVVVAITTLRPEPLVYGTFTKERADVFQARDLDQSVVTESWVRPMFLLD